IGPHLVLHVGQLLLAPVPGQVGELRVGAHGDDVTAHPLEPLVLLCQSSELGRSDEGEVRGVEEEDGPPLAGDLIPEAERSEISPDGVIGGELEVRDDLSQLEPGARIGHTDRPPVCFLVWTAWSRPTLRATSFIVPDGRAWCEPWRVRRARNRPLIPVS